MTLTPAYGRDYKSKAAVLADFHSDKDFIDAGFDASDKPINKSQVVRLARPFLKFVNIRYDRLRKVVVVNL